LKLKSIYIILLLCISFGGRGQVTSTLINYDGSSVLFNFKTEPAKVELISNINSRLKFYHPNTGEIAGRITNFFDTSTQILFEYDTLITAYGDTLKLIPDNFYNYRYNYFYNQYAGYLCFVMPDKQNDSLYHLVFSLDSAIKIGQIVHTTLVMFRVDFTISKNGANLLTPNPIYIGTVHDVARDSV